MQLAFDGIRLELSLCGLKRDKQVLPADPALVFDINIVNNKEENSRKDRHDKEGTL